MAPLEGVGVLITRPAGRAGSLVDAIEAAGGTAVEFPLLEIELQPSPAMLHPDGNPLDRDALLVFVSVYSVHALQSVLREGASLPAQVSLAAIGRATARALTSLGLSVDLLPQGGEDSESLLQSLGSLNLEGRQVVILRGQSGRELLARELHRLGAKVSQVQCYRRCAVSDPPMEAFQRWLSLPKGVVTITSVAILEALLNVVAAPDKHRLKARPVVALSDRIGAACRQSGFVGPIAVASGTGPADICEAIQRLRVVSDSD